MKYKLTIIIAGLIALSLIVITVIYSLPADKKSNGTKTDSASNTSSDIKGLDDYLSTGIGSALGVIMSIDHESNSFSIRLLDTHPLDDEWDGSNDEQTFFYNGITDFKTSYDKAIAPTLLQPGNFVDITFDRNNLLKTVTGSKKVNTYKKILNLAIDTEKQRILIGDTIYRYNNDLLIMMGDQYLSMADLSSHDVFNIYSVDNYLYLIDVAAGHGYLNLASYSDFIGGNLYINGDFYTQVASGLNITLGEGSYKIKVENEELTGQAEMRISPFETSTFDLAPFARVPAEVSNVIFNISPANADLYIDGAKTDYESAVKIIYGDHQIEASLGGYTSYKGKLTVERNTLIVDINLPSVPEAVNNKDFLYDESLYDFLEPIEQTVSPIIEPTIVTEAPTPTPTEAPVSNESVTDEDDTVIVVEPASTDDHDLVIVCTEGAAVFVNDTYRGVITNGQLTMLCPKGAINVRFTKEGYKTARYSLELNEDGESHTYQFPAMIPLSE